MSRNKSGFVEILLHYSVVVSLYLTTLSCNAFKPRKGYFHNEECLVHNGKALRFHDHNMILPIRTSENMSNEQIDKPPKSVNKKHYVGNRIEICTTEKPDIEA